MHRAGTSPHNDPPARSRPNPTQITHLSAQIAARHHDPVRRLYDRVHVGQAVEGLQLGDELNGGAGAALGDVGPLINE
jgi:hypothetical protein